MCESKSAFTSKPQEPLVSLAVFSTIQSLSVLGGAHTLLIIVANRMEFLFMAKAHDPTTSAVVGKNAPAFNPLPANRKTLLN